MEALPESLSSRSPQDLTNPTISEMQAAWTRYRDECFIRGGIAPVWVWSASHDFDFPRVGLHLLGVPRTGITLGSVAFALSAFDETYIVPLVRLTILSLEHLQPQATFDLKSRQLELRSLQARAEHDLERLVRARYDVATPAECVLSQTSH